MNKYIYRWKAMPSIVRLLLFIYSICFLIGSLQHWIDIFNGGLFPYHSLPNILNIYLTLLAVVDMAVSIMFLTKPITGLSLAILVMASDLFVDFYASYFYWHRTLIENSRLQVLLVFGLFVFISAPLLMRWIRKGEQVRPRS